MRAVRVRVDVGIHTGRMTFDEAVDYFAAHVDFFPDARAGQSTDPVAKAAFDNANRAIYRYSKWPTQCITYNLGKHNIQDLRAATEQKQGKAFNLKAFHEKFMGMGTIPTGYFREDFLKGVAGAGKRRQSSPAAAMPSTAAAVTSLRKCALAATRLSAHPTASANQTGRARGKSSASIASAPKATPAWLLGMPSPDVLNVRSLQSRNEIGTVCRVRTLPPHQDLPASVTSPPAAAAPRSSTPRRHAPQRPSTARRGQSVRTSAAAGKIHVGKNPWMRSSRPSRCSRTWGRRDAHRPTHRADGRAGSARIEARRNRFVIGHDPIGWGATSETRRGEPLVGFEPTTARLRIESSTPELQWRVCSQCPGADSNRDAFRHYPLKIACLPVSPPGRAAGIIPPRSGGSTPQHSPRKCLGDQSLSELSGRYAATAERAASGELRVAGVGGHEQLGHPMS